MDYNDTIQWVWQFLGRPVSFTVLVDGIAISSMTAAIPTRDSNDPFAHGSWGPHPSHDVVRGPQHLSFTFGAPGAFLGAEPWGDGLRVRFGRKSFFRRREIAQLIIVPGPDEIPQGADPSAPLRTPG